MTDVRVSVIVPTTGRPSLALALRSIVEQCGAADEVIVVGEAGAEEAHRQGCRFVHMAAGRNYGYAERNAAMPHARGTHLMFVDDDDVLLPGALAAVRRKAEIYPGRPLMFRMVAPWGELLWRVRLVQQGNVSGAMFVVPNEPRHLGVWGDRYEGDLDFIVSTLATYPEGALVWDDTVIYGTREHGVRLRESRLSEHQLGKVLMVHPGASWSTADVYSGLLGALRDTGVSVAEFRLDGRIQRSHDFLHFQWRQMKRRAPDRAWPKPTPADVLYQSSTGLVERALARQCEHVLVVSAMFVQPDMLTLARRAGLKVWLLCTETPYDIDDELRVASLVDGVWTHERTALDVFARACRHVGYLPHAWSPGVHDVAPPSAVESDVVFVGSGFPERIALLESVDWSGINLHLYGSWDMLPKRSPLRGFIKGGVVPNVVASSLYRGAKVGLNLYRTAPTHGPTPASMNPRAYELAAAGVCQVSEARADVAAVFGDAVPVFSGPRELEQVIRSLLADDAERARCGAAARAAVASETWPARVQQMLRDLTTWNAHEAQRGVA